jgi:hypothetical protein
LGTLFFILLIVLLLALLLGAGGYGVRRYWTPAGTETVTMGDPGAGALGGLVVAILAFLVMIMLFFGFTQWNWSALSRDQRKTRQSLHQRPPAAAVAHHRWRRRANSFRNQPIGETRGLRMRSPLVV